MTFEKKVIEPKKSSVFSMEQILKENEELKLKVDELQQTIQSLKAELEAKNNN